MNAVQAVEIAFDIWVRDVRLAPPAGECRFEWPHPVVISNCGGADRHAAGRIWVGFRTVSLAPATEVIVLNGGSSSGKSSIARCLQEQLPGLWLTFGVDAFIDALPGRGESPRADITYGRSGTVETGAVFKAREQLWRQGLATMARGGAPLILDEVFLSGGVAQAVLRRTMEGLSLFWVGVRCDPIVAEAREAQRHDRIPGMARIQAENVHVGMAYDVEVDTTHTSPDVCAGVIVARVIAATSP